MDFLNWLFSQSTALIGILSFTIFFGALRVQTANGHALTKTGKVFFAIGIIGLIGTIVSTHSNYVEDNEEKQRISKLAEQNDQLKSELLKAADRQNSILQQNSELLRKNDFLVAQNDQSKAQNDSLIKANQQLIIMTAGLEKEVNKQKTSISSLSSSNRTLIENSLATLGLAREQESHTRRSADIAELEAKRKENCSKISSIMGNDEFYMSQFGCADYYRPKNYKQPQVTIVPQYNYSNSIINDSLPINPIPGYGYIPLQ
ncbi:MULTISPECIES: hypothetical protein [Methylomonas]|uniref:Uncharacterized protein n=1 Tax=Methylomonas koyamae TaxID=702114 RepID=A0A177NV64_9GAMM|nr:hypothetical protein [Methylomonas koyamae]OAI21109.1 hypothetical protein A1355_02825 [Methylomonas koyamae]